ncbi:uncharacterized protein LOC121379468 [Gigantopelta aegis]|uniref:uncharacterized protein LOC121379468 n=1 Tax=Gigantopelta aegis TaxID=1735272 RepID=UPI001B88B1DF|nr:uncharacterized protein LOC121379468 [Gigantopelta aegis]
MNSGQSSFLDVETRSHAYQRSFSEDPLTANARRRHAVLENGKQYHAYFCHTSQNIDWVNQTMDRLESPEHNLVCGQYERDFIPGEFIVDLITTFCFSSNRVVFVLSPEFMLNNWAMYQMRLAVTYSVDHDENIILPIIVKECDIPEMLLPFPYIDARQDNWWKEFVVKLKRPVSKVPKIHLCSKSDHLSISELCPTNQSSASAPSGTYRSRVPPKIPKELRTKIKIWHRSRHSSSFCPVCAPQEPVNKDSEDHSTNTDNAEDVQSESSQETLSSFSSSTLTTSLNMQQNGRTIIDHSTNTDNAEDVQSESSQETLSSSSSSTLTTSLNMQQELVNRESEDHSTNTDNAEDVQSESSQETLSSSSSSTLTTSLNMQQELVNRESEDSSPDNNDAGAVEVKSSQITSYKTSSSIPEANLGFSQQLRCQGKEVFEALQTRLTTSADDLAVTEGDVLEITSRSKWSSEENVICRNCLGQTGKVPSKLLGPSLFPLPSQVVKIIQQPITKEENDLFRAELKRFGSTQFIVKETVLKAETDSMNLSVKKGDVLQLLNPTQFPKGRPKARNCRNYTGYIRCDNIIRIHNESGFESDLK